MTEKASWFGTGTAQSLGVDIATGEPSHIHIRRRRRGVRPGAAGTGATWNDPVRDEAHGVSPIDSNTSETRDSSTALVLDAA